MEHNRKTFPRRTFIAATAVLGTTALVPSAFADPVSDAQAQADQTAASLAEKQAQAEAALSSLNAMQESLDKASDAYHDALEEQYTAQDNMAAAQREVDQATKDIAANQQRLSTRVRGMYRNGSATFIDVLTGATSFEDFATGLDLLQNMSEEDAALVQTLKENRESLAQARDEYAAQEQIAAEKAREAAEVKAQAEETVSQYQATYDGLSDEVQALIEEKRAAEEAVREAQAEAEAQAQRERARREEEERRRKAENVVTPQRKYEGGSSVVDRAMACLGAPYVWGAVGPSGYDCSGLVSYCVTGQHRRIGTAATFYSHPGVSDPKPGDIVACSTHHCAVYIGNNQMIEAPYTGAVVKISALRGDKIVRL